MLIPAFKLELNNPILRGLAAVGSFDGEHPSLTCATSAGKIFFHSPHEKERENQVRFLNINRKISALACGRLSAKMKREVLLVGAQTTVLAYDVQENSDLFFKDAPDGVNTIVVGRFADKQEPLALVGGNCSIQGFDSEGNEAFWTVTGDNVSTMTFCDVDEDGELELLVGSEDFEIRVFRNEEVISETTETDRIVALCPMRQHTFAYALVNGTIGVYDRRGVHAACGSSSPPDLTCAAAAPPPPIRPNVRRWRVKAKHDVTSITGFDLDGDGEPELISGWSNGKVEVRSDRTGEVIFKDNLGSSISAILKADYRSDGRMEVIVCSADGEVRGYLPAGEELGAMAGGAGETEMEEDMLRELHQRKQELMFELRQYEEQAKKQSKGERSAGLVPPDTKLNISLVASRQDGCLYLTLESSNEARIKAAVVFGERVFEGESFAVHQRDPSAKLRVPLRPMKDVAAELSIKALVGGRAAPTFHVFELTYNLPRFAMFVPVDASHAHGVVAGVRFAVPLDSSSEAKLEQAFVSLRDGRPLLIQATSEGEGTLHVKTEDMELAGEVLQDVCAALQLTEVESVADFPQEMAQFKSILQKVDEFNSTRLKLTAEMADSSHQAKTLVVKAEDARILNDIKSMRAAYAQLYSLNAALIGEYSKRANNHEQLLAALKEVNHMIQKAAKLRVGTAKARVVSACRAAIKANNIQSLFQIIATGNSY
ncbi:hypothetical protein AB1Y20_004884 [Prymnesium parvum]|uniref:Bardet-Biedl syndrome 2 protein homolog n=1 Tax=Prymnesium parvum TaxID=97485 RepID=A0AB34J0I8_PRYPA